MRIKLLNQATFLDFPNVNRPHEYSCDSEASHFAGPATQNVFRVLQARLLQCKLIGRSIFLAPVRHVSSSSWLHIAMLAIFFSLSGKVQYLEHTFRNQLHSQGSVNLLR